MAGHKCLLGVDSGRDAIETFRNNHKWANTFHGDIATLNKKQFETLLSNKKVDLITGGPPCQGFSTVGAGNVQDMRNNLFLQFVRIVKLLNPKVVVFENVTGMLAKKNYDILRAIFLSFKNLGYTMDARVLSSEEYGTPEIRRRAIIIGAKDGLAPEFPNISYGKRGRHPIRTVGDAFSSLKTKDGKLFNHDVKGAQVKNLLDRKRLQYIPEGKGIRYQRDEEKYLPKKLHYKISWEKLAENRFRQTKLQRLDRGQPSPTIMTSSHSYYHPTEARYLTAREAASCQSFPNEFVFFGPTTSQFRQIGNAVPPLLAMAIGKKLTQMFNRKKKVERAKKTLTERFDKNAFTYANNTVV